MDTMKTLDQGTKKIPLTKGRFALVDDDDFAWLSQWSWSAVELKRKTLPSVWYAKRHSTWKGPSRYMHREILIRHLESEKPCTDHENGDGLDNRKDNIRFCSHAENNSNKRKSLNKTSKFKGVHWFKEQNTWVAHICHDGKSRHIGCFKNEADAAKAYDLAAMRHFGQFAKLNFP